MNFVRKMALVIIAPFLLVLLFALALDVGVLKVVGNPTSIKHALSDSGVYNSVVANALDQAQSSASVNNRISLTDPAVKQAAQEAFPPQVVQQSTEDVINGVYDWLNGRTEQPEFNVNLSDEKASFAEKVGQAAQQRATTLPACTSVPTSTDPLNVSCLPRGTTPGQVGLRAKDAILSAQGFLDHPNIAPSSIKGSNSSQSIFQNEQVKKVPTRYQKAKKSPIILVILTVLVILAIIFLSSSRRRGLRRVGITLLSAGVVLLLFAWALNHVATHDVTTKVQTDNKVLQSSIQKIAVDIIKIIDKNYWIFGGIYAVLGVVALVVASFWRRRNAVAPTAAAGAPVSTTTPPTRYKTPPKSRKTPKIQG